MVTQTDSTTEPRLPLSRERVLRAAIDLADSEGLQSLSMRNLAEALGVQAMSLYNHVDNKEDILNEMVDVLIAEIQEGIDGVDLAPSADNWKASIRHRALSARAVLMNHQWAPGVIVSRSVMTAAVLRYFDATLGTLLDGGFSIDLAHHAMHALGSSVLGFTQELFETDDPGPEVAAIFMAETPAAEFSNIVALANHVQHEEESILGTGCDDLFEFALDLMLDGLDRMLQTTAG